ncbi:PadR family transcriptional regulator [Sphingomonas sp. LB-2]|uniref:PadR family transcriptional regulator n=1 Tax=Sphingomonas caeni TaxID=2984949 RepID=UPI0022302B05|nr:PadR family transcriptional regulator [Sphingomonas caeni]MCW3849566.1 PadR family transcriptional regulator [Sphingomonas caeni]
MRFGFHHHGRGRQAERGEHGMECGPGGRRGGWGRHFFEHMADHHAHHHGRGGRRRMFDGSELRLILLKLIEEQPRHGYDLIREIEERSGGAYAPSPGVVYPTLTMLDDMGLVEEQKTEGAKKQFAITTAGQAHLTEREEEVEALFARLAELGSRSARTSGGPIRRAMSNLGAALQDRLGRGDVDADILHEVAAIIDEAVQKIERL